MTVIQEAKQILIQAGVREDMVQQLTATEDTAQFIVDAPEAQIQAIAAANPSAQLSAYAQASQEYGFPKSSVPPPSEIGEMGGFSYIPKPNDFDTAEGGQIRFNGVIADPETGTVIYRPNDPTVVGSPAWMKKIQDSWSQKKTNEWRDRLRKFGYEVDPKGGFDQTLMAALAEYHRARYLNFGKAIPIDQQTADANEAQAAYDPVLIRNDVRTLFDQAGIADPTDDEMKPFVQWAAQKVRKQIGRGVTPEHANLRTKELLTERFAADPIAAQFIEQQEEEEENTRLRDSLLSIAQITAR